MRQICCFRCASSSEKVFSFRGGHRSPDPLTRGFAPEPRLGLRPQTPRYRLALAMPAAQAPKRDTLASPLL